MLFLPNLAHCLLLKIRTVGSTSGKYLGVIEIPSTSQNAKRWPQIDCNGDDLFMARELKQQEGRALFHLSWRQGLHLRATVESQA